MAKTWYFDMDGTIADLYGTEGWLEALENERPIFADLEPLVDVQRFNEWAHDRMDKGDRFAIISWLPRGATDEYEDFCREEKKVWLEERFPFFTEIHFQSYGTPKQYAIEKRTSEMILVDDNEEVLQMWKTNVQRVAYKAHDFRMMLAKY